MHLDVLPTFGVIEVKDYNFFIAIQLAYEQISARSVLVTQSLS